MHQKSTFAYRVQESTFLQRYLPQHEPSRFATATRREAHHEARRGAQPVGGREAGALITPPQSPLHLLPLPVGDESFEIEGIDPTAYLGAPSPATASGNQRSTLVLSPMRQKGNNTRCRPSSHRIFDR